MLLAPSGTALFIANSGTNNISAYTVKTDGTLTACQRHHDRRNDAHCAWPWTRPDTSFL